MCLVFLKYKLCSFECYCYDSVCCKPLLLMINETNDLCMSFYLFITLDIIISNLSLNTVAFTLHYNAATYHEIKKFLSLYRIAFDINE